MKMGITTNAEELKRLFKELEYTLKKIQEFQLEVTIDGNAEQLLNQTIKVINKKKR